MKKLRRIKRIVVTTAGTIVLIIGIFLIVLPGPAFIVIPIGILILATEYEWARKLVEKVRKRNKGKQNDRCYSSSHNR